MDMMAIATLSKQMARMDLMQQVNVSVMNLAMDNMEQTGDVLAAMLGVNMPSVSLDGTGSLLNMAV